MANGGFCDAMKYELIQVWTGYSGNEKRLNATKIAHDSSAKDGKLVHLLKNNMKFL